MGVLLVPRRGGGGGRWLCLCPVVILGRAACVWIRLEPRVWAGAETNQICTPPPARSSSATAGDSLYALVVSVIPPCGDGAGRPGRKVSGALGLEFTHQLGQNWHQRGGSSLQREQPAGRLGGRRRRGGSHCEFSWQGRARRPPGGGKEQGAWGAEGWPRSMNVLLRAEGEHTAASVPGTARSVIGIRRGFLGLHVDDRLEAGEWGSRLLATS